MSSCLLNYGRPAVFVALCLVLLQGCGDTGNRLALQFEKGKIREAAQRYLDAEVHKDTKTVWACLAPSSHYMASKPTYEDYLEEAGRSHVRIADYKIISISQLRDNHDPVAYPKIQKFVQVEADVNLIKDDSGRETPVNYKFTFIKEGGKWYKG